MSAVGHADCAAHAEAALREVQAVPHPSTRAVEGKPRDVGRVDAALENEILHESADLVVDERGDDGCTKAEAAPQPARDVVFAATFPGTESPRVADSSLARVEAQHHFERHEVVAAGSRSLDLDRWPRLAHADPAAASAAAVSSVIS